jgi:hypothetical protein
MTKLIEGLRHRAYSRHISEDAFNLVLTQALQDNPEPEPSIDLTEYHQWNDLIVRELCDAFPNELQQPTP